MNIRIIEKGKVTIMYDLDSSNEKYKIAEIERIKRELKIDDYMIEIINSDLKSDDEAALEYFKNLKENN